jgi:Iron permease FTR1 family
MALTQSIAVSSTRPNGVRSRRSCILAPSSVHPTGAPLSDLNPPSSILFGLLLGIRLAALLAVALYHGAVRINFATFFRVTGAFLIVVAAGILAYGIRALQTSGWLPGLSRAPFDISGHFDLSSWYGALLQGVFNFRPDPTVLQVVAWCLYVALVPPLFIRPIAQSRCGPVEDRVRVINVSGEWATWLSVAGVGPTQPDR